MELKVNTKLLQNLVTKSMKGASCNRMIPLTGLMEIRLEDSTLTLTTTDATNFLFVSEQKVAGDNFCVVVNAEIFSKLITKLTCSDVTLKLESNCLNVKGNGNYSIELPLDEEGELIKFPMPDKIGVDENGDIVNLSTIKLITTTAKASLQVGDASSCYSGYYSGNNIIATDSYKVCGIDIKLFDKPALISPELMNLLECFDTEKISVSRINDTTAWFMSENCKIYGVFMENIEDYQVEVITDLLTQPFESKCKIEKVQLLQLLDRLALFVGPYDKNSIYLTFTNEGIQITSKLNSGCELIPYRESDNFKNFTCIVDIAMLRDQIKSNTSDIIEIQYGEDNAIKIVDGNVTQLVSLCEDKEDE